MNGKILFTVISAIIAITKSVTISHPQNPGGYHIGGVGVKHIREIGYCQPVAVPILFIIESPHVPPDTVKFFIRKLNVLLQHHNGFITMPRKKGCIVIFPTVTFQQRGKGGLFRASVVVHLAKIVKHTHNVGAAFELPFQFKPFCKGKKGFGYCKAMIEQCPGISPVVVNGSRGCEEPVFNQLSLEFFRNIRVHQV